MYFESQQTVFVIYNQSLEDTGGQYWDLWGHQIFFFFLTLLRGLWNWAALLLTNLLIRGFLGLFLDINTWTPADRSEGDRFSSVIFWSLLRVPYFSLLFFHSAIIIWTVWICASETVFRDDSKGPLRCSCCLQQKHPLMLELRFYHKDSFGARILLSPNKTEDTLNYFELVFFFIIMYCLIDQASDICCRSNTLALKRMNKPYVWRMT